MKMLEESSSSSSHPPRATLEVFGQPRSSVSSRRPSRDEAFPGGGLSSLSEAGTREGAVDGRAPLGRMTSSYSLKSTWKLKYQDFLPEKGNTISDRGEPFSKLVSRANEWLLRNPEVQLKSCETVTWVTNDENRLVDGEVMIQTQLIGENRTTYYVRGLRLWLCPATPVNPGESLAFVDVAPSRADDIQTLVGKVNKKIAQNQIKGQIFRLETLPVAFDRGHVDSTVTRWAENSNDDKQYVFVLRVFHVRRENEKFADSGKNRIQTAIKDFVPMPVDQSYEGFETLVERCNNWLQDQTDVSVVNFQSLMVQRGPFMDMSRSCHYTIPGCNSPEPLDVFRVLRVVVQRQSNSIGGSKGSSGCNDSIASIDNSPSATVWPFNFETFVPELLRQRESANSLRERMERMRETFSKVVAFLRISGAEVVGVETVMNPIHLYIDSETLNDEEQVFLFTLRIYITGQTRPYDGSVRSIKRASVNPATETGVEEAAGRTVPLFLGSVVQRKFKYRWIIIALFGFTCMTIIVCVSVIYSNK